MPAGSSTEWCHLNPEGPFFFSGFLRGQFLFPGIRSQNFGFYGVQVIHVYPFGVCPCSRCAREAYRRS